MTSTFEQLLTAYERGTVTRRQFLAAAAPLGLAGTAAVQQPSSQPASVHLNHVNLRIASVQRSAEFYQKFLGLSLKPTKTYHVLDCGNGTFMSLQTKAEIDLEMSFRKSPSAGPSAQTPTMPSGILEHFCLEVDNFDSQRTLQVLKAAGFEGQMARGSLLTADPDGILLQIVDSKERFPHEG